MQGEGEEEEEEEEEEAPENVMEAIDLLVAYLAQVPAQRPSFGRISLKIEAHNMSSEPEVVVCRSEQPQSDGE